MKLHLIGCSFKTTPLALRERLVFHPEQLARALSQLSGEQGYEALLISTCNRVELLAVGEPDPLDFLANFHGIPPAELRPHLYSLRDEQAVRHLFRVVASLDSLVVGEAQIAGQVKKAYETALSLDATGPLLNTLLPHARQVARRVRSETGISHGHVSVSSAAVDYVREVFDHFRDKTVLVIGAGKMGELTLRALRDLNPGRILVANRSPEKAASVAAGCGGQPLPWDQLDDGLAQADIILSTTGAAEPIVTRERFSRIKKRRSRWPVVILDIAVPRDFDPRIHDGDRIYLFNIDDLKTIRDATLARRREHIQPAERIVEQEVRRFLKDWARRKHGPVIEKLTREFEGRRKEIVQNVMSRLNGKLDESDKQYIDKAFSLFQNQLLHGPISALREEPHDEAGNSHTLLDALRKLFRLD